MLSHTVSQDVEKIRERLPASRKRVVMYVKDESGWREEPWENLHKRRNSSTDSTEATSTTYIPQCTPNPIGAILNQPT